MPIKNYFITIFALFCSILVTSQNSPYLIHNSNQSFVPKEKTDVDLQPPSNPNLWFAGQYFKLIQFYDLPNSNERKALSSQGLHLVDYLPKNTFFAVIDLDFDFSIIEGNIRSCLEVDERLKLESEIFHNGLPPHSLSSDGNRVNLRVSYYKGLDAESVLTQLRAFGKVKDHQVYARQVTLTMNPNDLEKVVKAPFVQFIGSIEKDPEIEARYWQGSGRGNFLSSGYDGINFNGSGATISVSEGGFMGGDLDFKGRMTEMNTGGSADGHKTNVFKRNSGAGNYSPTDRGVAWGADVVSATNTDYLGNFDDYGVRFTNHSYGWGVGGGYSSGARSRDLMTAENPLIAVAYSCGNNGGAVGYAPYDGFSGWGNITGSNKHSKNNFNCASVNEYDSPSGFSSLGPASDGRIFPQIAIEGNGGTSYAAPKIVGTLGVLSEVYQNYHSSEAPSSLLKAVLLNTADDIHNEGPDFKTGYGRVNLRRAHQVIENNQIIIGSTDQGSTNQHSIFVPANTAEVKVMVYWADVAASVNAATHLVNDLDMVLTSPNSTTYLPWVLDHTPDPDLLNLPATRGVDRLNNTEQITIDSPNAGSYDIEISGFNVPFGPQEYFLIYDFIPEDELQITHPIQGEKFTNGASEVIYWDAANNSNSDFVLEFQLEGGSWESIGTAPAEARAFDWTPPAQNEIKNLKIRVARDGQISESNTLTTGGRPNGLNVGWICGGSVALDWNDVAGATAYQVYVLEEKYMEAQGTNVLYTGSSAVISGLTDDLNLIAVSAITDGKEGRRSDAIEVDLNDDVLNISTSSSNASCGNNDGSATAASDVSGISYTWSNGEDTPTITNLAAGTYTVTVTNNGGCEQNFTFDIQEAAELSITTVPANGGSNGSASVSTDSGIAPFSYAWSNGGNTATIENLEAGVYGITVTDANGCLGIGEAVVPDETPTYCDSYGTNTNFEWIESVELANIINFSGNNGGYGDFTILSTELTLGETIFFNLTPGFNGTIYNETWRIWIDFNRDLDFDDPGEEVFLSNNTSDPINSSFLMPNNVMTGSTRMRISMLWDDVPEPCEIFTYGEVEDYTVNIVAQEPLAVNIFSTDETCLNDHDGTANITAIGGTGNYNFQWSNGANTNGITNLAPGAYACTVTDGIETVIVSTTIAPGISNTFFADNDNDGFGDANNTLLGGCTPPNGYTTDNTDCDDDDPNNYIGASCDDNDPLTINDFVGEDCICTGTPTYCESQGSETMYEWIESVTIGDLNNVSGANGGYGNFTNLTANLELGETVNFTLTPGFSGVPFAELWKIWIDFNQDFDFNDAGEEVYFGDHINTNINGSFTLPEEALLGETRMRISMKWGNVLNPCDNFIYGEVEDYTVVITDGESENIDFNNGINTVGTVNSTMFDDRDLHLFPNPSDQVLHISHRLPQGQYVINVFDIMGKQVLTTQKIDSDGGQQTTKIRTQDLAPGNYFIQLNGRHKTLTEQFIKM